MPTFFVTYNVDGQITIPVAAKNFEDAIKAADKKLRTVNVGNLEGADYEYAYTDDDNGTTVDTNSDSFQD